MELEEVMDESLNQGNYEKRDPWGPLKILLIAFALWAIILCALSTMLTACVSFEPQRVNYGRTDIERCSQFRVNSLGESVCRQAK